MTEIYHTISLSTHNGDDAPQNPQHVAFASGWEYKLFSTGISLLFLSWALTQRGVFYWVISELFLVEPKIKNAKL